MEQPQWIQRFKGKNPRQPPLLLEEPPQGTLPLTQECGVSLAWLQRFMMCARTTLKQFKSFEGHHTEAMVNRVIVPLCRSPKHAKLRLFDLCPPEHRGQPHYYIVHTWSDCIDRVIEEVVRYALQQHAHNRAPASASASTASTPRDESAKAAAKQAAQMAVQKLVLETTYVWVDVCALSQHACSTASVPPANLEEVRASITNAQRGTLVVIDRSFDLLSRCWCMLECWMSVYYRDCEKLQVLFPEDLTLEELVQFQQMCSQMDLKRGYTSKPADKQRIIAEIKHKAGVRRMQQLLPDSLMRSARSGLRWSGAMNKLSMYCAMLLQNREWHQVQTVLHSIPEIHDDEKMLQEIRDVFAMYDTDGSGELDHDEFVEVLGMAGFDAEEAHKIFSSVDVDNGGSVSLAEFETWWIESQRQQSTRHNARCEYTGQALIVNLNAIITTLERQGIGVHVPFYKSAITRLQQQERISQAAGRGELVLLPSPIKGDWHAVAEQCAWKVSAKDYQAAAGLMFGLLLWNADMLSVDPSTLSNPDQVSGTIPQLQLLCQYMVMFGQMLAQVPTNYRQSEYFFKAANEIKENILEPLLDREAEARGMPRAKSMRRKKPLIGGKSNYYEPLDDDKDDKIKNGGKKGKKAAGSKNAKKRKPKLFPGKFDMQREALVSEMVKLKYGPNTLITAQQIVEAEKSLGAWMAAQKSVQGRGTKQDDREAVADFTSHYLFTGTGGGSLLNKGGAGGGGEEGRSNGASPLPPIDGQDAGRAARARSMSETPNAGRGGRGGGGGGLPNINQRSMSVV